MPESKSLKVVAFLPAKGTSSRIESKNIRPLDGKPLFLHTLEKLVSCSFIDKVYLDTESEQLFQLARHLQFEKFLRDPALATNSTDGHKLFMNEVNNVEPADIYIQILGTSPFVTPETIKKGIDMLSGSSEYDSVVLVKKDRMYTWKDGKPTYDLNNIPNSFNLEPTVIETMGLYIVKREAALATKRRIGDRPFLLEASPLESVDVNYPEDFEMAELIAAGIREKKNRMFKNFKNLVNSAVLSDVMDELGLKNNVLKGYILNDPTKKVIGWASTLRIRKLKDGEDYRGIYRALDSYRFIGPYEIILVENEVSDKAYFGELNANLALRSGAVAAVIGGMTRDSAEVKRLGFTTFAKGCTCSDVKGRATTDYINGPITLDGIEVCPGDLVFGDVDGIVVIPRKQVDAVIEKALQVVSTEKSILVSIATGDSTENIVKTFGFF